MSARQALKRGRRGVKRCVRIPDKTAIHSNPKPQRISVQTRQRFQPKAATHSELNPPHAFPIPWAYPCKPSNGSSATQRIWLKRNSTTYRLNFEMMASL